MQQLIVRPLGIVTEPNKLANIPVGALTVNSIGTVMRSPGTVEAARSWFTTRSVVPADRGLLFVVGKYILLVVRSGSAWIYYWMDTSNNDTFVYSAISLSNEFAVSDTVDTTGRFGFVTVRDRSILAASNQLFVWDTTDPTTLAQATGRTAGIPTPLTTSAVLNSGSGIAGAANTATAVVSVIRRTYADGYEIFSAPSIPAWVGSIGANSYNISVNVVFDPFQMRVGDVVEVYKTKTQAYTATSGTNLGSDYFLSMAHALSSTELAAGQITLTDKTPDQGLGEALYTNTAIAGGAGMALAPPVAKCLAYFRGHTFYGNYTQGASWEVRAPVFWGSMQDSVGAPATVRSGGVGSRVVVGNTTNGSPTVSAVSAGDIVGIVIGQIYNGGLPQTFSFSPLVRVTAVGATTITMSGNAIATATGASLFIEDAVEITYKGTTYVLNAGTDQLLDTRIKFSGLNTNFSMTGLGLIYPPAASVGTNALYPIPADSRSVFIRYMDGAANSGTFTVRATNGNNYQPQLPRIELGETAKTFSPTTVKNGLGWSEPDQPEYFCGTNVDIVGRGEIYAIAATRDALWVFASDGLWRWSGTGGDVADGYDWRLDPVDSTLIISGPQAYCVLRDTVFAFTTRGLVSISSDGTVKEISFGRMSDAMPPRAWVMTAFPTNTAAQQFDGANAFYLVADEQNGEVVIRLKDLDFTVCTWTYNVHTDAITRDLPNNGTMLENHSVWNPTNNRIYVAGPQSTNILVAVQTSGLLQSPWTIETQPIVIDDPFTIRQFLQLEVSFESDAAAAGSVACYFNGNSGVVETRALTVVAGGSGPGTIRRTSFAVPRNSPAVSYVISANLRVTGLSAANYVRFLGAALKYSSPSEQRKDR
jgi:hypothetical protein